MHAGAGIEEREEDGVIATSVDRAEVCGFQDRLDLFCFEILDRALGGTLERHSKETLASLDGLGVPGSDVTCEDVDVLTDRVF